MAGAAFGPGGRIGCQHVVRANFLAGALVDDFDDLVGQLLPKVAVVLGGQLDAKPAVSEVEGFAGAIKFL